MTGPFSGSCTCGSIHYECTKPPLAMLNCHCLDCQRSSGAPFASGVIVRVADTEISGTPKAYAVRGHSGALATRRFCGECGPPLFTRSEVERQVMSIRFPTLDDQAGFRP